MVGKKFEDALSTCRYEQKNLNDALKRNCVDFQ